MNEETKDYPISRFLAFVREAAKCGDRGTLAELRRGLGETTQEQAWRHLIPFCGDFDVNPAHRAVWCTVGGLAALLIADGLESPADDRYRNLGTTMRELAKGSGDDGAKALKTFEPMFRRILSAGDTASLCELVSRVGRTADTKGVKVNLLGLFWELWNWDNPKEREKTRLRWAQAYFRAVSTQTTDSEGDPT